MWDPTEPETRRQLIASIVAADEIECSWGGCTFWVHHDAKTKSGPGCPDSPELRALIAECGKTVATGPEVTVRPAKFPWEAGYIYPGEKTPLRGAGEQIQASERGGSRDGGCAMERLDVH